MKQNNEQELARLATILQSGELPAFRDGFANRVMAHVNSPAPEQKFGSMFDVWAERIFPRVAFASVCFLVALATWNLSTTQEGTFADRLLLMPSYTLENGLDYEGGNS
jgi:hypothetical protein